MQRVLSLVAVGALLVGAATASGQQVLYDFEDGTDQGFGNGFGNDASEEFPIVDIGGSNRMEVLRDGGFQEAGREITSDPALAAMNNAASHPSAWTISYDYYIDTSLGDYGSFLQLGTYINAGSGAYQQDFPDSGKDLDLGSDQLASGQVFAGTISETLTDKYGAIDPGFLNQTFQRLGFIINGNGADATVYFDNIRLFPEPASITLFALAWPALLLVVRRRMRP